MMSEPKYTKDHEWVRLEGDNVTMGISSYAQEQLGDVVFVDLPAPGTRTSRGREVAVVESVKAASEVFAPVSGEVVEANDALSANPGLVNEDPEGGGWFVRIRVDDPSELDGMMTAAAYADFVDSLQ
jgi:glycine cleavage system H protein